MLDRTEIRNKINSENPEIVVWEDGVARKLIGEERKAYVDQMVLDYENNYMVALRQERNSLLFSSDWTQVLDASVDTASWAEYRQALRDLPANTIDPENPVWPTPPE